MTEFRRPRGASLRHELTTQSISYFPHATSVLHTSRTRPAQHIDIPRGSVVISIRNEWQAIEFLDDTTTFALELGDDLMADVAQMVLRRPATELVPDPGIADGRLTALFEALKSEHEAEYATGQIFSESLEQAIVSYLLVNHGTQEGRAALSKGGLSPTQARRVAEYVQDNLSENISTDDMARVCGLSASHFSRSFTESFDETPHRYLTRQRMILATRLLRAPEHSILDVAQLSGFKTQQHFTRIFSQATGTSPGNFRRQM